MKAIQTFSKGHRNRKATVNKKCNAQWWVHLVIPLTSWTSHWARSECTHS